MDISRAKTVMIIAFLILNVFLLQQLWQEEGGHLLPLDLNGETSRLEIALEEANLTLEAPLPRGGERMAHLFVEPKKYDTQGIKEWLADRLLEGEEEEDAALVERVEAGENESVYGLKDYRITFGREGIVTLEKEEDTGETPHTASEIQEGVEEFFEGLPLFDDFVFDFGVQRNDKLSVFYHQEYEGVPLYAGYARVKAEPGGAWTAQLYSLEPLGLADQDREVISPAAALLRFVEDYGDSASQQKIEEVALGYYSQEYDAQRWEIPPTWRIRLENGEVFYVNAFTGYVER